MLPMLHVPGSRLHPEGVSGRKDVLVSNVVAIKNGAMTMKRSMVGMYIELCRWERLLLGTSGSAQVHSVLCEEKQR